jgi:selenocysteine lyase/cysteine desulfurase
MIDAPPGSNVVVDPTTYPSALAPWLLQSKRDVELRCVSAKDRVPLVEDFERLVDEKTVAVSVSHVCRVTGFRHDLHALGRLARATGAYLLVDGAQSVGAIQLNVHRLEVDFLTFGTMKWLLGPPGVGVLWMRPELMQRLSPPHVGPGGTTLKWDGTKASLWFADTAIRHELSSSHYAGIDAALAGVNLLSTISAKDVEARVLELSQHLIEELVGRGIRVWTPQDAQWRAGVVAFETDDPDSLRLYLRRLGVDVWGYQADRRMRADPHVYNSHEDIDRLLAGLDEYNGRQRSIRISRHFRANMRGFLKRLWKSLMKRLQSPEPALRAST